MRTPEESICSNNDLASPLSNSNQTEDLAMLSHMSRALSKSSGEQNENTEYVKMKLNERADKKTARKGSNPDNKSEQPKVQFKK